jgi:hypothetical protein
MADQVGDLPRFPSMPPPPPPRADVVGPPPRLVRIAAVLLLVNLALSVLVTVLSFVLKDDIIRLTLEQTHRQDATDTARQAVITSLWVRAGGNLLVGVLYVFFISRLYRGKRWAWRRLVFLSIAGCVGMIFLLTQHYPPIFKVEQVVQLLVLATIAVCVLHPDTRAHYAKRPRT